MNWNGVKQYGHKTWNHKLSINKTAEAYVALCPVLKICPPPLWNHPTLFTCAIWGHNWHNHLMLWWMRSVAKVQVLRHGKNHSNNHHQNDIEICYVVCPIWEYPLSVDESYVLVFNLHRPVMLYVDICHCHSGAIYISWGISLRHPCSSLSFSKV